MKRVALKPRNLVPKETGVAPPGSIFGRLTVIRTGKIGPRRWYAFCRCSCGSKPLIVRLDALTTKTRPTRSCGCLQARAVTTHGRWKHPLYHAWHRMIDRCHNPRNKRWKDYGARGIKVCVKWKNIEGFIRDMSPTYRSGLELDRIDNSRDYSPSNCRWSTHSEQARNKRTSRHLTFTGETKLLAEWARELRLSDSTIRERIDKLGWSVEQALSTPPRSAGSRSYNRR